MSHINTYPLRQTSLNRFRHSQIKRSPLVDYPKLHAQQVAEELRQTGISRFGLASMEAHHVSHIVHPNEHIGAAVFGYTKDGYAMIVATDSRVIFLDNKPLFTNKDEITYGLVGGISCGKVGPWATVTLHTKLGDYKLKSGKYRSVRQFVDFIEQHCLEHKLESEIYDDDFKRTV